ncbi:unnamed protein product, partial [marine sediment metagenome]
MESDSKVSQTTKCIVCGSLAELKPWDKPPGLSRELYAYECKNPTCKQV